MVPLCIFCSGFNPNEKLALKESIKIMGSQYEFSEKTTHLICD